MFQSILEVSTYTTHIPLSIVSTSLSLTFAYNSALFQKKEIQAIQLFPHIIHVVGQKFMKMIF